MNLPIIITLAAIISFAIIVLIIRKRSLQRKENAIDADAILLNKYFTGLRNSDQQWQTILQLQISPEPGKSFVKETTQMISKNDNNLLQPGVKVIVKYHHKKISNIRILHGVADPIAISA